MGLDTWLAAFARLTDFCTWELARREPLDWVLCFAPVILFLELPRDLIPPLVLAIARLREVRPGDPSGERARAAFLQRRPSVSCIIAGRNERETILFAVRSLQDQDYPPSEVIVVDDASEDGMAEALRPLQRAGVVRLVRNEGASGRGGRPSATNLGLRLARGEFVVSLDADTTFDRSMLRHVLAPFADARVGVVAGNVVVRNPFSTLLVRLQALEYAISIDIHKRWTDLYSGTLFASGALGAFRRAALLERGGWSQDVAEDADLSLHMRAGGWKVVFARDAVARTNVPTGLGALFRQRTRWDCAGWKVFFHKHRRALRPSVSGWGCAAELWAEGFFSLLATALYPWYLAALLWLGGPFLLVFVLGLCTLVYSLLALVMLALVRIAAPQAGSFSELLGAALVLPLYKEALRWVRVRALYAELLGLRAQDPFLPQTAWRNLSRRGRAVG